MVEAGDIEDVEQGGGGIGRGGKSFNLNHQEEADGICWRTSVFINENFAVSTGALFGNYFRSLLSVNSNKAAIMEVEFDPFRSFGNMRLSAAGEKMKCLPNAGGSSVISEVLSYEVLRNCFGAELDRTEMELVYFPEGGSMVDYTCRLFQRVVGVSVTRAMKYSGTYEVEDAQRLLVKKLEGAMAATKNCLSDWSKRILHIWASSERVAALVQHAYNDRVPHHLRVNTIVLITVASGSNAHDIFYENSTKKRQWSDAR